MNVNEEFNESLLVIILVSLGLIVLTIVLLYPMLNNLLINPINRFQEGLNNFFKYLNKESSEVEFIELTSKDELGQMSKLLNDNIKKAQKDIEEDRKRIQSLCCRRWRSDRKKGNG